MKKIIAIVLVLILVIAMFTGCNRKIFDTTYNFDEAYVYGVDGKVIAHGKVEVWDDYENSDSVSVKIDGVEYYTHISNVILIAH